MNERLPIWLGKSSLRTHFLCLCLIWVGTRASLAADWRSTLPDGSQIQVDSQTHRAWRLDKEHSTPLWDGTHRLNDGSVIIIRHGTAVPTREMLDAWNPPTAAHPGPHRSPCDALFERVCGIDGRCVDHPACQATHQLLDMAGEERGLHPERPETPETDAQCREALESDFFVPCD